MTFGSLFAGIGGFDLGFERAGMRCVWQVEIDPYCRKVLAKHWPDVPKWDDVKTFTGEGFERPDVICGGFPCQDISLAGDRGGLAGERSGLWFEFARIIRLVRPRFIVVENVPGLLSPTDEGWQAPIGCVLGELASGGYDAEWQCIPASSFGSTQQRFRVFIVAYPTGYRNGQRVLSERPRPEGKRAGHLERDANSHDANSDCIIGGQGRQGRTDALHEVRKATRSNNPDSDGIGIGHRTKKVGKQKRSRAPSKPSGPDSPFVGTGWWSSEPSMVRMVYGVSRGMVRTAISGLGNAVVPQVAEWIGRRLMEHA